MPSGYALLLYFLIPLFTNPCFAQSVTSSKHPIIYNPIGTIINSGSHYIVPLRLDLKSLLAQIDPLESSLFETSSHYESLQDLMGHNSSRKGLTPSSLENFPSSLRSHITLLMADLHQRVDNLKNLLLSMSDFGIAPAANLHRSRRGLFNFGGSTLSWLFGVVDSSTFEEAQSALDRLESMTEQERVQMNLHSSIINVTQIHIQRIEMKQLKTLNALEEMDSNVRVLSTALLNSDRHVFGVSNALAIVSAISYVSSAINDLTYEYEAFSRGLSLMMKGNLSPALFNTDNLLNLLDDLNSKNVRTLWPSSKTYVGLYYKFCDVLPLNFEQLTFLVMIPLLPEPTGQLDLYRISSLPYPINTNVTLSYGELSPYIGISQDHALYMILTDVDLTNCRQFASLYYCDAPRPLYKSSQPNCEYALFTDRNIETHCTKHVSKRLSTPLLIRASENWLYATSEPFALTVVCPSETKTLMVQVGVGIIDLPQKCRASTDFALIPTSAAIKAASMSVVNFTSILPFKLTFTKGEQVTVDHFSNDSLYQDLLRFNGASVPLDSLNNELGQLRLIQKSRIQAGNTSVVAGWTSFGIAIFLLIVCLIIALCCYLLHENKNNVGKWGGFPTWNRPNQREARATHMIVSQEDDEEIT